MWPQKGTISQMTKQEVSIVKPIWPQTHELSHKAGSFSKVDAGTDGWALFINFGKTFQIKCFKRAFRK